MDQNIRSDQDNSDGNHRNESNEVASTSSSSTSNVNVEVTNLQQIKSNNINEEYCNNPVKKNDDLTHFELSNVEFRRALQQNENRKACEANYVRNPMELYDSEPVYEVTFGNLCNNPFDYPPNDDKKRRFTITEYLCEDDEDSDASTDSETSEDEMSAYIQDFVIYVTSEVYLLDCSRTVNSKLQNILYMSNRESLATQLMDAMQKLLEPFNHKSDYVGILLNIIINVCKNDNKAIHYIGDNVKFIKMILSHLKSVDDTVLLNLLKLLQFAVSEIQKDPDSRWLNYLKECDSFGHSISVILKFMLDDTVVITTTELLKEIAKISLPNQSNFLHQLINVHDLIPILMTLCTRMIMWKTNEYTPTDLQFLYNWLSIMMTIEADLIITFEKNEEKGKHVLLKILFHILYTYAYRQEDVFSPQQEVKQHVDVLFKSISLLSCLHRRFFVPMIMDRILMKIILKLAKDLKITSKEDRTSSDTVLLKFSRYLDEIWLSIIQRRNALTILKLMKQLDDEELQYFMNLGYYDAQIQYKMKKVHAKLKRHWMVKRVSND